MAQRQRHCSCCRSSCRWGETETAGSTRQQQHKQPGWSTSMHGPLVSGGPAQESLLPCLHTPQQAQWICASCRANSNAAPLCPGALQQLPLLLTAATAAAAASAHAAAPLQVQSCRAEVYSRFNQGFRELLDNGQESAFARLMHEVTSLFNAASQQVRACCSALLWGLWECRQSWGAGVGQHNLVGSYQLAQHNSWMRPPPVSSRYIQRQQSCDSQSEARRVAFSSPTSPLPQHTHMHTADLCR